MTGSGSPIAFIESTTDLTDPRRPPAAFLALAVVFVVLGDVFAAFEVDLVVFFAAFLVEFLDAFLLARLV